MFIIYSGKFLRVSYVYGGRNKAEYFRAGESPGLLWVRGDGRTPSAFQGGSILFPIYMEAIMRLGIGVGKGRKVRYYSGFVVTEEHSSGPK